MTTSGSILMPKLAENPNFPNRYDLITDDLHRIFRQFDIADTNNSGAQTKNLAIPGFTGANWLSNSVLKALNDHRIEATGSTPLELLAEAFGRYVLRYGATFNVTEYPDKPLASYALYISGYPLDQIPQVANLELTELLRLESARLLIFITETHAVIACTLTDIDDPITGHHLDTVLNQKLKSLREPVLLSVVRHLLNHIGEYLG